MRAARLHAFGEPLQLDDVPAPEPGPGDAVVDVRAVFVPPLLKGRLEGGGDLTLPSLPATFGYGCTGVVALVGTDVEAVRPGERVYVAPLVAPPADPHGQGGRPQRAAGAAFLGDFAFSEAGRPLLDRYAGALAEQAAVPARALVRLPDALFTRLGEADAFAHAARLGYHGTAYRALRRAGLGLGDAVVVQGATGTLGAGATLVALAMGAARVVAVARDRATLQRAAALDGRVRAVSVEAASDVAEAIAEALADLRPEGADVLLDALPAPADAAQTSGLLGALRPGGTAVLVGGPSGEVAFPYELLAHRELGVLGAQWCTPPEVAALARLLAAGALRTDALTLERFPLDRVNEAVERATDVEGFTSVVVEP